jgi:uncharacterized DUF497 family protein
MNFEFDEAKSSSNKAKHGIDFIAAQALWDDALRMETPALSSDEPRSQIVGRIGDIVWSAFITQRNENIRIFSVRRARENEEEKYHGR